MAVLINFKICDNAKECSGIAVCKTGALSWDAKKKTIKIDNSKCISCGACEKACPIDAIKFARNKKEYAKLKKEIEKDTRNVVDLFVDRYGAKPISHAYLIDSKNFDPIILQANQIALVEIFDSESINCLLNSIPIKDLFSEIERIKYRKMEIKDDVFLDKYKISKLPVLLFFKNGKLIGKIEGYFDKNQKSELKSKITKLLEQL